MLLFWSPVREAYVVGTLPPLRILMTWELERRFDNVNAKSMSTATYQRKMQEKKEWCPGWEAITDAFQKQYGTHAVFIPHSVENGELSPLDGVGVYHIPGAYLHLVTRGLTAIHANPDAFGSRTSGWGYELTLKWPAGYEKCLPQAIWLMERVAQRIEINKHSIRNKTWQELGPLEPSLQRYGDRFCGLLFVPDTSVPTIHTLHGNVEFRQMVNLTGGEVEELKRTPSILAQLLFRMKRQNPLMLMEPRRQHEYLLLTSPPPDAPSCAQAPKT